MGMINHKYKVIFIHIPKTGGTSVREILRINDFEKSEIKSHPSYKAYTDSCETYKEYFTFTIVRNPYDKMVSQYKYFTESKAIKNPKVNEHYKGDTFKEFLKKFYTKPYVGDGAHRKIYTDILHPVDQIDFIGRFENFQQDFDTICDKIGIPQQKLPHKNATKHKHYTEYYDEETKQIVAEKYAKDIEYFGYKFGE